MDRGWGEGAVQGLSLALKIGEPCLLRMGQQPEPSQACCHLGLEERQSSVALTAQTQRQRCSLHAGERHMDFPIALKIGQLTFSYIKATLLPSIISSIIASTGVFQGVSHCACV